jgi:hypothetical protein
MATQAADFSTQAGDYTRSLADCRIIPPAQIRAPFSVFKDYSQSTGPVEELVEIKR